VFKWLLLRLCSKLGIVVYNFTLYYRHRNILCEMTLRKHTEHMWFNTRAERRADYPTRDC